MIEIKISGDIVEIFSGIITMADNFKRGGCFVTTVQATPREPLAPSPKGDSPAYDGQPTPVAPSPEDALKKRGRPAVKKTIPTEPTEPTGLPKSQTVTLADLRMIVNQLMERHGSSEQDKAQGVEDVKTWLASGGVTRLRELPEESYTSMLDWVTKKGWVK